ncbi:class I SAM-dependent methyltransferase [Brevibacillus humidisoli]|uniref:class I SAM-dependent methyltransferase n=1 Tax=Brevibacillus humidisoli TaxID=2895522 RepID=UPI001E4D64F3|nr:class I SAM-dependent methyltransferase [Brevibacillus humidisoli]UFJ42574.1 class I SAM-dependent methyltransferase [Brevibacillus humidisoli]
MIQKPTPPDWSDAPVVENYTDFSREAFWGAYHWQAAVGLYRSGLHKTKGDVLDIGCGPGWLTFILKDMSPEAFCCGLDLSEEMVEAAQTIAQQKQYTDLRFVQGDAGQLPFPDNSFDLVTSCFSFRLWDDQIRGLQEAYRVVRPGGLVYIADISGDVPLEQREQILDAAPQSGRTFLKLAMEMGIPEAEVRELATKTGIPVWECRIGGMGGYLPTQREVLDWVGEGFPLRHLYSLVQGKDWARELGKYWFHLYLEKP